MRIRLMLALAAALAIAGVQAHGQTAPPPKFDSVVREVHEVKENIRRLRAELEQLEVVKKICELDLHRKECQSIKGALIVSPPRNVVAKANKDLSQSILDQVQVREIYGSGKVFRAVVAAPGGVYREVRAKENLGNGIKIVSIKSNRVVLRHGKAQRAVVLGK